LAVEEIIGFYIINQAPGDAISLFTELYFTYSDTAALSMWRLYTG
jgi:hypothetical protein